VERPEIMSNDKILVRLGTMTKTLATVWTFFLPAFLYTQTGLLYPIEINSQWGFIDSSGRVVITPRFATASPFENGVAQVRVNDSTAFLDGKGQFVKPPTETKAGNNPWSPKRLSQEEYLIEPDRIVVTRNGKKGLMNAARKLLTEIKYDDMGYSSYDGLIKVRLGGERKDEEHGERYCRGCRWGFVNRYGKEIIPPVYQDAQNFSDGAAWVKSNGAWGIVDTIGRIICEARYQFDLLGPFQDGVAIVNQGGHDMDNLWLGGKWGLVDKTGHIIAELQFDDLLCNFDEGERVYRVNLGCKADYNCLGGKWGAINKQGKLTVPIRYNELREFHDGIAWFKIKDRYGLVDENGRELIPAHFEDVIGFYGNYALAKVKDQWGFIDKNGNFVVQPAFTFDRFEGTYGDVAWISKGEKFGVLDFDTPAFSEPAFDATASFDGPLARVSAGTAWGYINKTGKIVWWKKN
jgi:hypothetical protein